MRVASLLPSATEIVHALGLERHLVAVTFECDQPPTARERFRVIVSGRDTSAMTPGEIDAYVREQRTAGRDLYTLDEGAFAQLAPDVVLTQDLCRVCALPAGQVDVALAHLRCRADVVTLDPSRLDDVLADIVRVAAALGEPDRAVPVVADLRARLAAVARTIEGRSRPRTTVVEWVDPLFCGGHWIPDQVVAAGGEPVGMHPATASGPTSWDALRHTRPEVVVVAPCGYGLEGAAEQARLVAEQVPDAQVWAIDGDAVVVRPGPRLVDGVEALASILHPDVVPSSALVGRVV